MRFIDIVFDAPPGPEGPRFIEIENPDGESIIIGLWLKRGKDGAWVLRVHADEFAK